MGEEEEQQRSNPVVEETEEEETCPDDYYFKGFLAWCLWGYIPIDKNGEGMKSNLFSDSKSATSFGRNTGSRSALKKASRAAMEGEDGLLPIVDERHGTKKQRRSVSAETGNNNVVMPDTIVVTTSTTNVDSMASSTTVAVLTQTLAFIDSESIEKQLQKNHLLQARIVRDELASTIRMSDRLWQRCEHNPQMQARLDPCDANIARLELLLKELQSNEVARRTEAIATRALSASSAIMSSIQLPCPDASVQTQVLSTSSVSSEAVSSVLLAGHDDPSTSSVPVSIRQRPAQPTTTRASLTTTTGSLSCICIDCSVTTTSHRC